MRGGDSIISADDRLTPVLAFVESGPGISKSADLPGGLLLWMKSTKDQIQNIRKAKLTKKTKKGGRATSWLVGEKAPLLRTRWRQAGGRFDANAGWPSYNQQIPYNCPGTDPNYQNGHALVGCVGVAVAQVVRYWGMQNPWFTTNYQYNWSNAWNGMPVDSYHTDATWEWTNGGGNLDGHHATDEVARLMADAAREVHTNYGCDGSSAVGTTRVVTAFRQHFGYSSASYSSTYRPHDVVANLNMNWPVILGGYTSNFMWWGTGSGHSWVCDGYRAFQDEGTEYCYYDEYNSYQCYTPVYYRLELHMNWGWGGQHNGWFSSTYFGADVNGNVMPHNYQCNLDELLDIHP
jgi:Peptidase C10 family